MSARHPESVGRYRILGEVGRGAMGAVYRAEDPKLRRVVAVKMMLSQKGRACVDWGLRFCVRVDRRL